jgi:hypothetical protein
MLLKTMQTSTHETTQETWSGHTSTLKGREARFNHSMDMASVLAESTSKTSAISVCVPPAFEGRSFLRLLQVNDRVLQQLGRYVIQRRNRHQRVKGMKERYFIVSRRSWEPFSPLGVNLAYHVTQPFHFSPSVCYWASDWSNKH